MSTDNNAIVAIDNNPIATTEAASNAAVALSPESLRLLQRTYYPDASPEMIRVMHGFCAARGVDHTMRPGYIVKAGGKETIWPSIHLYRVLAHRSMYAGMRKPEYGPTVTVDVGGRAPVTGPEFVRMTVLRRLPDGTMAEFFAEAWLAEWARSTPQWIKSPRHMLALRAECFALRAAFPEVGGMPTWEEMRDVEDVAMLASDNLDSNPAAFIAPRRSAPEPRGATAASKAAGADSAPSVEEFISGGMRKQIARKFEANKWGMDVMELALGRKPADDLSDITKAEWAIAKEKLSEYAKASSEAMKSGVDNAGA